MCAAFIVGLIFGGIAGLAIGVHARVRRAAAERRRLEDELRQLRYQAYWNATYARTGNPGAVP